MALGAGVGAELGVAAHAHRPAFVTDEPLPPEVVSAVETLRAVRHRHSGGIQSYYRQTHGIFICFICLTRLKNFTYKVFKEWDDIWIKTQICTSVALT